MAHVNLGALLRRHEPRLAAVDPASPLQLGNGMFALAIDPTGLQTFPGAYPHPSGTLLGTRAPWAWTATGQRLHLGLIGLDLPRGLKAADLEKIDQSLDFNLGMAVSRFQLDGARYAVHTAVDTRADRVATRVATVGGPRVGLKLRFPAANATGSDAVVPDGRDSWLIERKVNGLEYTVRLTAAGAELAQTGPREFLLSQSRAKRHSSPAARPAWTDGVLPRATGWLEAVIEFAPEAPPPPPPVDRSLVYAAVDWRAFWDEGGRIDLSGSQDPRAFELERRILLSHYLVRINHGAPWAATEAGLLLPADGFHLQNQVASLMALAQWGHADQLEMAVDWFDAVLESARANAEAANLPGARWPQLAGPDGSDWGGPKARMIWQQPQPIVLAEAFRRITPTRETLERYADLVFETADCMAAYPAPVIDLVETPERSRPTSWGSPDVGEPGISLGPPLVPAQESGLDRQERLVNPTFELAWWHYGLALAAAWADDLGLKGRAAGWRDTLNRLPLPQPRMGRYPALLGDPVPPLTSGHPMHLAALGLIPRTGLIDDKTMEQTLEHVLADWDFTGVAGWDFPFMAMTATRLHRPDLAIKALLMNRPENAYLPNGHNWSSPEQPASLAANGALLLATGLMAAGWDGSEPTPGFPKTWSVVHDRIARLP